MDKQNRDEGWAGRMRSLAALLNGDREDSRLQYIIFGLVIVVCIVAGVVINAIAGS